MLSSLFRTLMLQGKIRMLIPLACLIIGGALSFSPAQTEEMPFEPFADADPIQVAFTHGHHIGKAGIAECNTCHHIYVNGKKAPDADSTGRACFDCHSSGGAKPQQKYAFHSLCINCHQENPAAPLTCQGCHPGLEETRIQEESFRTMQRPPSLFDHTAHGPQRGIETCTACHHLYGQRPSLTYMIPGQECSDCHLLDMGRESIPDLQTAYHDMCLNCHEQRGRGPLACGECHAKE